MEVNIMSERIIGRFKIKNKETKKKIKCRYCGEIFDEADLLISEGEADTNMLLSYDWGVPIWYREEIRRCPHCKCTYYEIKKD